MQPHTPARVRQLLDDPASRVIAFDPSGAAVVPLPEDLPCRGQQVEAITPLDPLGPASQGKAVALFDLARRHGAADGSVTLADDTTAAVLHIIDLSASHGVFLGVLTDLTDATDDVTSASTLLPPRRFTNKLSPTGVVLDIDADFTRALGWEPDHIIGQSVMDLIHPDDHERSIVNWAELLDQPGNSRRMRQRMRRKDDSWVWIEATDHNRLADVDGPDGPHVYSEFVDISDEMEAVTELHKREALLARVTEAMPTGVLHVEPDGTVVFANARWWEITGLPEGAGLAELLGICLDDGTVEAALDTAAGGIVDVDLDIAFHHEPSGDRHYGRLSLRPLDPSTPGALLLAIEDRTAATTLRLQLAEDARRDPLTKLLNRAGIRAWLDDALASGGSVAVLYLDLDRFKAINDRHSHARGDGRALRRGRATDRRAPARRRRGASGRRRVPDGPRRRGPPRRCLLHRQPAGARDRRVCRVDGVSGSRWPPASVWPWPPPGKPATS